MEFVYNRMLLMIVLTHTSIIAGCMDSMYNYNADANINRTSIE